jgi:hypothetical protein
MKVNKKQLHTSQSTRGMTPSIGEAMKKIKIVL